MSPSSSPPAYSSLSLAVSICGVLFAINVGPRPTSGPTVTMNSFHVSPFKGHFNAHVLRSLVAFKDNLMLDGHKTISRTSMILSFRARNGILERMGVSKFKIPKVSSLSSSTLLFNGHRSVKVFNGVEEPNSGNVNSGFKALSVPSAINNDMFLVGPRVVFLSTPNVFVLRFLKINSL